MIDIQKYFKILKVEIQRAVAALQLPERYRTGILMVLVCGLIYLNWSGHLEQYFHTAQNSDIANANSAYLVESEKQALKTYLLLTEFSSGLALLQSSQAGISLIVDLKVQLGGELNRMSALIGKAEIVSLMSLAVLHGLKLTQSIFQWLAPLLFSLLLGISVIYLGACFLFKSETKLSRMLGVVTSIFLLLFLSVHLLFPLSIYTCNLSAKKLTNALNADIHSTYESAHNEMIGKTNKMETTDKIKSIFTRYEAAIISLPHKISMLTRNFVRHLVTTVFNVVIFPLGYFYFLVILSKRVTEHGFNLPK